MLDGRKMKENKCPYCCCKMNAATSLDDEAYIPVAGDLSFCIMCCEASQYDKDMKMVKFDIDSIKDLMERNKLKNVQAHIRRFWEENPDIRPQ